MESEPRPGFHPKTTNRLIKARLEGSIYCRRDRRLTATRAGPEHTASGPEHTAAGGSSMGVSRLHSALRNKRSRFPCCTTPRVSTQPAEAANSIFAVGEMVVYDGLSRLIVIGSRLLRLRRDEAIIKNTPSLYVCYISSSPNNILVGRQRGFSASAGMALPQSNVGDQNRWSLSNNAPFFLCISVISWCRKEVGERLEKVSEGGGGC